MKKAFFLDRDGVVNVDHGYVGHYKNFEYVDGIFSLILYAQEMGYLPVIVTNQSGIARGLYSEDDFVALMAKVQQDFTANGIGKVAVYYCPHHQEGNVERYAVSCTCRKPKPGMMIRSAKELNIDLANSIMIGDSWRDIEAADSAGIQKSFYLSNSPATPAQNRSISTSHNVYQVNNLDEVIALL